MTAKITVIGLTSKEKDMNKLLMVETTNYVISSQKRWQD